MSFIVHQTQPTYNTCVSACLAMILNKPVQEVIDEFHAQYHLSELSEGQKRVYPADYLRSKGVPVNDNYRANDAMDGEGVYMIVVPSLNIVAGMHCILYVMYSHGEEWMHALYDPAKGRIDKKYYISDFQEITNENEVKLSGFVVELQIPLDFVKSLYGAAQ